MDPKRVITDIGMDEISLKKRHKLYVTLMTDLTHPGQPEVLAVMSGRDEAAARQCLERLRPEQRAGIKSYRVDMGAAYNSVCAELLPKADGVIDRFHVAQLFNGAIDDERKKNHASVQGKADAGTAEGISFTDVAVSARSPGIESPGAGQAGDVIPANPAVASVARFAGAFQEDL